MIVTRGYGDGWETSETHPKLMIDIINFIDENCEKFKKEDDGTSGFYDNDIKISISPPSGNTNYQVTLYNKNNTNLVSVTISTISADSGTVRIAENINKNCLVLEFSGYEQSNQMFQIIFITTETGKLIAYNQNVKQSNALSFGLGDGSSAQKPKSVINRLPYSIDNKVEIIQNKIVTQGTVFEKKLTSLYDCSSLSPHTQYVINGKNYYTINENTLMEV